MVNTVLAEVQYDTVLLARCNWRVRTNDSDIAESAAAGRNAVK